MSHIQPIIKLYKGFASDKVTCIYGHVLRSVSKQREKLTSNPFKNALEMYRRYNVSPMKRTMVGLRFEDGYTAQMATDKRGFFLFKTDRLFYTDVLRFVAFLKKDPSAQCEGEVYKTTPELIVVSDIDDTILISHATNLLKKLYLLLTKNHESRKAFAGIRKFYGELSAGEESSFFYVSSSEWNLYDFLNDFVRFNELPEGIFLLQDIKSGILDLLKSGDGYHSHKKEKVITLLESFPSASFVLVGDSGQKDPYLYREIAIKYPDRIRSIHIRDVRSSKRTKVLRIANQLAAVNIKMELFSDS